MHFIADNYKVLQNKVYNHLNVNHSENVVDLLTGVNTRQYNAFGNILK